MVLLAVIGAIQI